MLVSETSEITLNSTSKPKTKGKEPNIGMTEIVYPALKPLRLLLGILLGIAVISNILTVALPNQISNLIDQGSAANGSPVLALVVAIFGLAVITTILGSYFAQHMAFRMRNIVFAKLIKQPFRFVSEQTSSKLLSILTSDIDVIRDVVNQAMVQIISAIVLLIGSTYVLLTTNWRLALASLTILPILAVAFGLVLSRIIKYFVVAKTVGDMLNRVISESIGAAGLIRVLNTHEAEKSKLQIFNTQAKEVGLKILKGFGIMIPTIAIISSLGTLIVLYLGGNMLLQGELTLGQFIAFNTYLGLVIFPIVIIGFIGSSISSAFVSLDRIAQVIKSTYKSPFGSTKADFSGEIAVQNIKLEFDNRPILKGISLRILAKKRTAILGPTGSGKTQLMYLMSGLLQPNDGQILFDYKPLFDHSQDSFYEQVGLVFQDSVLFNTTLRENVAFKTGITDEQIWTALEAAELADYVRTLPEGLETKVSERGTNLSGGQKQRLMLARALAASPRILFLDDFTARVDVGTEERIWANLQNLYPQLTLVVITQKISTAKEFDHVVLLMEGELLAAGTHTELLAQSPEYNQIVQSQQSTNQE